MTESTIRYDDEHDDKSQDPDVLDLTEETKVILSYKSRLDPEHAAEVEKARKDAEAKRDSFGPITG